MIYLAYNQKKKIYLSQVIYVSRTNIKTMFTSLRTNAWQFDTWATAKEFIDTNLSSDFDVLEVINE